MVRMFVRHTVEDFTRWKQGYDAFDPLRRKLGVRGEAVFKGTPDAVDVTIWHDFDTMDAAQAFITSSELAAVMAKAGVVGQPQVWFADRDLSV